MIKLSGCFLLSLLLCSWNLLAAARHTEDFSKSAAWEIKEWGENAQLSVATRPDAKGQKLLQLEFNPISGDPHPKGIVLRHSLLGRADAYQHFRFSIYLDHPQPMTIQTSIDADRNYQGPSLVLKPGWNRQLELPLLGGAFSAQDDTGTKHNLVADVAVGSLILSFHRQSQAGGRIYVADFQHNRLPQPTIQNQTPRLLRPEAPRLTKIQAPAESVALYQTLELTIDLDAEYIDPYDSKEIAVQGLFTGPSGQKLSIDAYLDQGEVDGVTPVRQAIWKLRFTPPQVGAWSYRLQARNPWGHTETEIMTLNVREAKGQADGFIRIDPQHPRYFAFDSGRFYYPLGKNVAWLPFPEYKRYFKKMADHGENWARIWMSNWSFGIEWKPMGRFKGLGNYNLERARQLDELLALAANHGLYLQLVLDFHGSFSKSVNPEWLNNPYNVINGGYLDKPEDFFTNARARADYRKRLRYIVARWAHSPHIMAWEFFNEVGYTHNFNDQKVTAWHKEMSEYIKSIDPYQHLTTTSYGSAPSEAAFNLSSIDYVQHHIYATGIYKQLNRSNRSMAAFGKPYFVGEFGGYSADGGDDADKRGVLLHTGLWTQFMQNASGNAMPWWWDTQIEPNNLYYHFYALAKFAEGLDRRQHSWAEVRDKLRMQVGDQPYDFELIGLKSSDYSMFWLCDALGMNLKGRRKPLAYEGVKIALDDFAKRAYTIEYWDTYRGRVVAKQTVESEDGQLRLDLPKFSNDLAIKVRSSVSASPP